MVRDINEFSSYKVMNHWEKFKDVVDGKFIYPITVEFSITNKCNSKCLFCNDRKLRNKYYEELPVDIVKKNLTDMSRVGVKGVVFEGGGEPTVHPDFAEIITYAKSLGFQVGLITNGYKLKDYYKEIMDSVEWVRISLDAGLKSTHQKLHGVDRWDDIWEGIKKMGIYRTIKKIKSKIGISYIMFPSDNYWKSNVYENEPYQSAHLSKMRGCDYIQFKPLIKDSKFIFSNYDFEDVKRLEDKDFKVYIPSRYSKEERKFNTCYAFWFSTQIGASGHVHLCCNASTRESLYLGNIKNNLFSEIWTEKKILNVLKDLDVKKCPVCRHDGLNNLIDFIKNKEANAFV